METSQQIDFGRVVLRILDLLIVRIFTLPYKIYKNALIALSNADNEQSEDTVLATDFPLYTWYLNIFNAIIALSYPLGVLSAIGAAVFTSSYGFGGGGFGAFLGAVIITYFVPLWLGLLKEFLQIPLKALLYLKITANK
ncbi:hypothetical protein [Pedobacter sp.]